MIIQNYPNPNRPIPVAPPQVGKRFVSAEEYNRREKVIADLATSSGMQVGDTYWPANSKDASLYGPCMITGIARHYHELEEDHVWPQSDNPMIITFVPLKNRTQTVFCTVNYLTKKNDHACV